MLYIKQYSSGLLFIMSGHCCSSYRHAWVADVSVASPHFKEAFAINFIMYIAMECNFVLLQ